MWLLLDDQSMVGLGAVKRWMCIKVQFHFLHSAAAAVDQSLGSPGQKWAAGSRLDGKTIPTQPQYQDQRCQDCKKISIKPQFQLQLCSILESFYSQCRNDTAVSAVQII